MGVYIALGATFLFAYVMVLLLVRHVKRLRRGDECVVFFIVLVLLATCFLLFLVVWCTLDPTHYNEYINAWHAAKRETELDWKAHKILEMRRRAHIKDIKDVLRELH